MPFLALTPKRAVGLNWMVMVNAILIMMVLANAMLVVVFFIKESLVVMVLVNSLQVEVAKPSPPSML